LDRKIGELAGDCRIDWEDGWQIAEAAAPCSQDPAVRDRIAGLIRRCAASTDPKAFAALRRSLQGGWGERPDRALLSFGAGGPEVRSLREALGAVARFLRDPLMDPGSGTRFDGDTRCALVAFQTAWQRLPSGDLDSSTLLLINFALSETEHPLLDLERLSAAPRDIRLHFYPGDGARTLVVRQDGREIDRYDMRGGPARTQPDPRGLNFTGMPFSPTRPGAYTIAGSGAHVTAAWKFSQIPWGAALREKDGQIQFQALAGGPWRFATGPRSVFAGRPEEARFVREDFLVGGRLPERYTDNDFGHRAVYLERGGRRQGHMIHSTPREEAAYGDDGIELLPSHGCEHMRPADLDEALAKGYFRPGSPFIVHGYDEVP
jgi:hypothetical protein